MRRKRVLLFGYLKSWKKLDQLYHQKKFVTMGENSYVVIRADIVDNFKIDGNLCNVIIPIDAYNNTGVNKAKANIENSLKIKIYKTLTVKRHIPDPPHLSHGYINTDDINLEQKFTGKPSKEKPGRQHMSPGPNAWG